MVRLIDANPFRRRKIAALKKRSFAELSALPERTILEVPNSLKGLDAFIRREPGERGGVAIIVSVGYAGMEFGDGFEMLPNGKVLSIGGYTPEPPRRPRARQTKPHARQPRRDRRPPTLPRGIKAAVLRYLHLEYGEASGESGVLRLSDLSYEGEHQHDGVPTHFWSYPTSSGKSYATVVLSRDGYEIGITDGPPGARRRRSKR